MVHFIQISKQMAYRLHVLPAWVRRVPAVDFRGLGTLQANVESCVEEANDTLSTGVNFRLWIRPPFICGI
jgi:hypothetical protein